MKLLRTLFAGLCLTASVQAEQVSICEVMYHPAGTKAEYIEFRNLTTNRIDFENWKFTEGIDFTFPDFAGGTSQDFLIKEKERFLVSSKSPAETRADYPGIPAGVRIFGPWTGSLDNAGERISLMNTCGGMVCSLKYGDGGKWSPAADGAGHSLVIINEDRKVDDWRNWRAGTNTGGTPGTAEVTVAEEPYPGTPEIDTSAVVSYDAVWHFYGETAEPPANWNTAAFTPSAPWGSGPALLGFETAPLPLPGLRTSVVDNGTLLTYYFRTSFEWAGPTSGVTFTIDQVNDDGAVYFLNGTPLGRVGINNGALVHNSTVANRTVGDAVEELAALTNPVPAGALVAGTNIFSAIALQVNTTSSDMVFAARLKLGSPVPATIVINEIKPSTVSGQGFIEFYNTTAAPVDLGGHYLGDVSSNLTKFQIPGSLMVPPGGLVTVDFAPTGMAITSPMAVYLTKPDGATIANAIRGAVPADGRSLGRKPAGGASWYVFLQGTPGAPNSSFLTGGGPALSEVHFDASGHADWIELRNPASGPAAVNGLFVASQPDFSGRVALTGSIGAGGHVSFATDFVPDGGGDLTLYLIDSSNNVLETAQVTRRAGRPSIQRVADEWYSAALDTRDSPNNPARHTDIVINEVMFNPPSDHRQGEFVELRNRGAQPVDVSGWSFSDGVDFTIPAGTSIPPGGHLVVAQCASYIAANYPGVTALGDYGGSLGNSGDLIRLIDANGNMADKVDYKTGGDWPFLSDRLGSSMELRHPDMDNNTGVAWAASDESNRSSFTTLTYTGTYRDSDPAGFGVSDEKELHLNLVGDGHILIDGMVVRTPSGTTNLLLNGGALPNPLAMSPTNSGANGWRAIGTHAKTFYENGVGLHLISDGPGDLKGNLAELDVPLMAYNSAYELIISVRWISGKNRLIAQTWNRTYGTVFTVPVPNNLGTPGALNSAAIPNPAPAISRAIHSPAVPRSTGPVTVTAALMPGTPLASVEVLHRPDNVAGNGTWVASPMFDDATNGDLVAADGTWAANISAYQTDGAIAQFYVRATAANGQISTYPRDGATRPAMWIVDNSPPVSDLLIQRFVMSERDRDALGAAGSTATHNYDYPRMSNHYFNGTLIVNERDITYNVELRKSGSPWTREGGNGMGRVRWKAPKDRLFRDREKSGADDDAGAGGLRRTNNRMVRYWLYLLGYPVPDAEYVQVQVNNLGVSLKDDIEPTDTDFLSRYYPNAGESELYEIDDAWYFSDQIDGGGNENRTQQDGNWNYSTTYGDSPVYWHGSWPIHTAEHRYDYSAFGAFVKAIYNGGTTPGAGAASDIYREKVERQLDVERWAMYAAARGWAGDWDNFTLHRGKNGYFYRRSTDGKFEFHHWDSDLAFGNATEAVIGGIGGTTIFSGRPWARRALNYYLTEIYNKWAFNSPRVYAWLQGLEDMSPSYTIDQAGYKSWFQNRQASISSFINQNSPATPPGQQNFTLAFSVTAPAATVTAPVLILAGRAPSTVFMVTVDGHPEGVLTWLNAYDWQIAGLRIREGPNTMVVRSFDRFGVELHTQTVNTTKTGDAPPVVILTADPASWNVDLGDRITIDAAGSVDPEGTALTLAWSISPAAGVSITDASATAKSCGFSAPGVYTVTVMATDGAASSTTVSRDITVTNSADFVSFGDALKLPAGFTAQNVELRDGSSPGAWYPLEDQPGRLTIDVTESAKPLANPAFTHPLITRDLPDSGNWTLQTEVTLETRQFGGFFTGLWFEGTENGQPVRYAFGIDGGDDGAIGAPSIATKVALRRAAGAGVWIVATSPVNVNGVRSWRLRVTRQEGTYAFAWSATGGSWTTFSTQPVTAPAIAGRGGVFVSTSLATSVRVSFDYLLLSDPANALSNVAAFLRITEVMYNPVTGGAEFIELKNTGHQPISLDGVTFGGGQPFFSGTPGAEVSYRFGNESMQPGGFIVVPEDTALFRSIHGPLARLAPPWTSGNLSNGGEHIVLMDNTGTVIPGHDFDYDDVAPWPLSADGTGPSLEIIDWNGNYSDGANWRASSEPNGSPGFAGAGPDRDGDGSPDSVEALFGTNPNDAGQSPRAAATVNAATGHVTLTWPGVAGVDYRVEVSSNLTSWTVLQTVTGAGTYVDTTTPAAQRRCYRIAAVRP